MILYEPTVTFINSRLLDLYEELLDAENVFDKLPQLDVFTYNAMLITFGCTYETHKLFIEGK